MAGDDDDIQDMIAGHRRFKQSFERDRAFFLSLARGGQKPRLLWIGCSDSRVIPDQITRADPGELFVIRNIANVVPPAHSGDDSVGAAIEYCVERLGVDDIVICGHSGCGGIKALGQSLNAKEPHLKRWVEFARPSLARLDEKGGDLLAAVKANVLGQRDNLLSYECVRERMERGAIKLHGWVFDMESGDILTYDDERQEWRSLAEAEGRKGWFSRLLGSRRKIAGT